MVSRGRLPGQLPTDDQSAVVQVRIPAHRLDQLMLLADRRGMLATAVVRDLVLDHLDQQDPEGEFLFVPAAASPSGGSLASITRLPVMSGMSEATSCQLAAAPVTPLRPGSDYR